MSSAHSFSFAICLRMFVALSCCINIFIYIKPVFEIDYMIFPLCVFIIQAYLETPSLPKGYKISVTLIASTCLISFLKIKSKIVKKKD